MIYDTSAMSDEALGNDLPPEDVHAPIEVHFFAAARAAYGEHSVAVQPGSLTDVLQRLVSVAPALGEVLPRCSFLINGYVISDVGSKTEHILSAGDRLDVLPPFAGG